MTEVKGAHRTWCYTINNYTDDEINKLKVLTVKMHRCAKEVGENGTPHLQGAITFERTYRMAALKKLFPRAHWKPGKTCDPENYCIKGEIIIDTVNREQGKRTDLAEAIEVGRTEGYREMAIAHPETFVKYHRGLKELLFTIEEPKEWYDTKVYIFWGPTGSSKSRKARQMDPNLYNVPEPNNGSLWFDEVQRSENHSIRRFLWMDKVSYFTTNNRRISISSTNKRIICAPAMGHSNYYK